jgi:translation initiation factor IF-2
VSANPEKDKNNMTDHTSSGASFAPAADTQAPAASAETPAASFGSTRGSGLARGRRPSGAQAPAANPVASDYKPTSVEIITAQREYKNPFASPEPENVPAAEPVKQEAPVAVAAPVAPVAAKVEPQAAVAAEPVEEPVAERREIQILPPAESIRPSVSWESPSASRGHDTDDRPRRDERPTFRADRREDAAGAPSTPAPEPQGDERYGRRDSSRRQPRDPRELGRPHDPYRGQPRDPRDYPEREPRPRMEQRPAPQAAAPEPKGFIAWLKGLFGAPKPAPAPVGHEAPREGFGDGHRPRRRHRGGRGHGGPGGFRGDRTPQGGERMSQAGESENRGGDRHGGPRRRRGGGHGRDRGGDYRSQGSQGGGAI